MPPPASPRPALEAERKQLTILFADIVDSTEIVSQLDAEDAQAILDGAITLMMEAVHHYGGTVTQTRGDSIVALFGAPIAHEDHAVRACYAALAMHDAIRRDTRLPGHVTVGEEAAGQGSGDDLPSPDRPLRIRIGLNSGEVVVRAAANDLDREYTAMGQAIHLAARMEQMARPGAVIVTAATRALVDGFVEVRPLGSVTVRGLAAPVEIGELVDLGPARTRLDVAASRGLTRFVGRQAEIAALHRALRLAEAGFGQTVAIVGEPAVGKSRLVWELTHSERTDSSLVLATSSVSYGQTTTFFPVRSLLRAYAGVEPRDDPAAIRQKVARRIERLADLPEATVPAVLALLDVPADSAGDPEQAAWAALDPAARRRRTLDAITSLLLRESEHQPLLLVFEDLHWIDGETQALLDTLVERLPSARLLLVVNYRPEYRPAWGGAAGFHEIRLEPLPPENADELLDALLGADANLGPLKHMLIQRTEANPLFLEESVQALVETSALAGERGARRLTRAVEQLIIPTTVQAILAARIDRLTSASKRLLQEAAVIGKDVPLPLLAAVAEAPEAEIRARLSDLQGTELLYQIRPFPDPEYTFKHALTHEVAYQGLLRERRRALHARVMVAIERLAGERGADQYELLAHHALRAELWERAVGYLKQAGRRAMDRAAYREAVSLLEQAVEALGRCPASRENSELTVDLQLQLRSVMQPLGDYTRMGELLRDAAVIARSLGDQRRLAEIVNFLVNQSLATGDYDEAITFSQEALGIGRALGDLGIEIRATSVLGQTYDYQGKLPEAAACFERIVALDGNYRYERFGGTAIQWCLSGAWLADVYSQWGRFDEAIARATAAIRVGEEAENRWSVFRALWDLGRALLRRGDLPQAIDVLQRSLNYARTWQFSFGIPHAAVILAVACAQAGRIDEAVQLVCGPLDAWRQRGDNSRPTMVQLSAVAVFIAAGRLPEADALVHETIALARRLGARGFEADALRLAAEVAVAAGDDARALGCYRASLALAEELGMRPLVAHASLGIGNILRRVGRPDEARRHLTAAVALLREMVMPRWLPEAEAALAAL